MAALVTLVLVVLPSLASGIATASLANDTFDLATSCSSRSFSVESSPKYEQYEMLAPNEPDKEATFARSMDELMLPASNFTSADFEKNMQNMGPTMMQCSRIGGGGFRPFYKQAFGNWPERVKGFTGADSLKVVGEDEREFYDKENVGVAIRSISKVVVAATFLALSERLEQEQEQEEGVHGDLSRDGAVLRLSLDSKVGDFLPACRGTSLEYTSVSQLLSLSGGLDDRINQHWRIHMGGKADHVGFPSYCDENGMEPVLCTEQVICPAYKLLDDEDETPESELKQYWTSASTRKKRRLAELRRTSRLPRHERERLASVEEDLQEEEEGEYQLPPRWGVPEVSCLDEDPAKCAKKASEGECDTKAHAMLKNCPLACGICGCLDKDKSLDNPPSEIREKLSEESCRLDTRNPVAVYGKARHHAMVRGRDVSCIYDNYSYTVLDAMVTKSSGRPLWEWAIDLIARPLGMMDTVRCMTPPGRPTEDGGGATEGIPGCYVPPLLEEMYDVDKWPLWPGGPESLSWAGIQIITSAEDFSRFIAMIANRGTVAGVKIISEASADEIFKTRISYVHGHCMGMDSVGLGMGKCEDEEISSKASACTVGQWWGWGGSYGSRFMILPDAGVACVTLASMPIRSTASSTTLRFASRQHTFAHLQAELAREVWPVEAEHAKGIL